MIIHILEATLHLGASHHRSHHSTKATMLCKHLSGEIYLFETQICQEQTIEKLD